MLSNLSCLLGTCKVNLKMYPEYTITIFGYFLFTDLNNLNKSINLIFDLATVSILLIIYVIEKKLFRESRTYHVKVENTLR